MPELAEAGAATLRPIVEQWHQRALPVIRTKAFADTWADFLHAWPRVMFPVGVGMEGILRRAREATDDPPEAAQYADSPQVRLLVLICREAQRATGTEVFFLSCHQAGAYLGVTPKRAWLWLNMLVADGVLQLVKRGTPGLDGKATRWRFLGAIG